MPQAEELQIESPVAKGWLPEELLSAQGMPSALVALFEGHPDMVILTDDHGLIVGANARALSGFGYVREKLEGQSIGMLLPEGAREQQHVRDRPLKESSTARVMGSGLDLKACDVHGRQFPVDVTLYSFDSGSHNYVMTVCRRLNASLARSLMHVRALVESVRDYAINMLDAKGRILTWNEGSRRIHGLTAPEVLGKNFAILYLPEEVERGEPARMLEATARNGRDRSEGWRLGPNGSRVWVEIDHTAIFDDTGKLTGFTRVVHDLTEHKLAEENLKKLNAQLEQYRVIIENIDDHAIYTLDAEGRVASWGTGAQNVIGYKPEEVQGKHYSLFWLPEEVATGGPERELAEAAATGRCYSDAWRRAEDGSRLWLSGVLTAVRDESRKVIGFIRVARDRTEQKKLGDALERFAAELEERVADRTRQLEETVTELSAKNDEVRAYVEIVSRDLREKEILLREIHHRVKNNLQVVQSLLKMRARLLPEGDARTAIDTTVERVNAMALVHERLYQMPDLAGLPLSGYVQDLFRGVIASNSLTPGQVQLQLDAEDIPLTLDRAIPFGLLVNELLCNCLKHGFPEGKKGTICIDIHQISGAVRMTVKDDGIGLPENFDPAKCTSMGMKLAASLARQLGGNLQFKNDNGCRVEADLTRL